MARKIKLQWLLLEIVGFILITSVIHASETEISNDDLKTDDETHVPDFFNVDNRKGHITKLLRRVVRGADDVVTLLNEAANTESNGVLVFDEVRELETLRMRGSKGVQMHIWNDQVIVSITDNTNMVTIYSMDINTLQVKPIGNFPGISRCDLTSVPEGQLVIACINLQTGKESSRTDAGVRIYLLEESTKDQFNLQYHQFLHTNASSHLSLWQQHRETMLMVCSASWTSIESTTAATQDSYQSILYRWTGQYFDVLQRFSPSNTSAVHHFVINNQHFIAEAHFTNSKGHHNCYSTIFRYSSDSKNYMPYQLIPTKGAKHFTSFSLHADGRTNTFLAVANFCQDNHDGTCDPYTSSGIYCYHHDRFVLFQEIPTAHAFQWLVIEIENTVLLAVANALTGVNMYQYNGWRFVLTESQYVVGPFGHGVTGLAAVELDEKILLGISYQDPLQSNREMPVFFSITFRRENFLKTYQVESERWCGGRLQSLEEARFINASAVDIPLSTDARYTFAEPVTIKGDLLVTKEGSTEKVFVQSTNETLPGLSTDHKSKFDILKKNLRRIEEILKKTIPIKGNITWPSGLYFRHLDSTESPDFDIIGDATGKYINGLPSSNDDLLQLRDNLRIPHLDIALVEIQVDAKVDKMLGRPFSAYTTLSGHHVTKQLRTFLQDLDAQEVNSQQIISETADGNQRLLSIVSLQSLNHFQCSSVSATELHCGSLNGINVTSLYENVVTTEDNHNITGLVKILDNLNYNSNLRTDVSSSINLQTPMKLHSHNPQIITGDHKVQDIEMNWLKVERINTVNIPQQLLLNRSDYSYTMLDAHFTRLEANSVFVHSRFGSIQVKNGSLDVLTLNDDQFVTSRKVFDVIQLSSSDIIRPKRSMEEMDYRPWKVTNSIGSGSDYQNSHLDSSLDFVLSAVRSEAEINGLLYFMDSISPGNVLMPVCHFRYFKKLLDVSPWEFPYVHGELVLEGKDEPSKRLLWNRVNVFLNQSDVRMVIDNAKRYKMQLKERLNNVQLNWFDIYKMFETARESLVTALKKHTLIMEWIFSAFDMLNKSKESKAKKVKEGKYDATKSVNLTESEGTNHDDILDFICRTVQQISRYPMILRRLVELPTGQSAVMERAIMEHDFSWFLTIISKYEDDVQLLKVDASCEIRGVADFSESILTILRDHRHHMTSNSDVSIRSKRNDKLIELRTSAEGIGNPDILGNPINPRSLIGYWNADLQETFNIPHRHDPSSGKVDYLDCYFYIVTRSPNTTSETVDFNDGSKNNLDRHSGIIAYIPESLPEKVDYNDGFKYNLDRDSDGVAYITEPFPEIVDYDYYQKCNIDSDSGIVAHSPETTPETDNTSSFVTDNILEAGKENDRGESSSDDQYFPQWDVDQSKLVRPSSELYEGSENMTLILVRDHRAIPTKVYESNIYVYPTSIQMTAEITDIVITASSKAIETPERMQELQVSGDQLTTRMNQPIISPVLDSEYRNRSEEDVLVMATTRTVNVDSLFAPKNKYLRENTPKVSAFQIGLGSVEYLTSAVDSGIGIAMSSSESVVETHSGINFKEISSVVLSLILSTPVHSVQNMIQQVNYNKNAFAKNMTASSILVEILEYPFSEESIMSTPEFLYPSSIMLGEMKTSVLVADGQNSNTLVLQAVTKAAVTPENELRSTLIADQHSQIPESVKTVESWTSQRYQQSHAEEQYSTFYIVENLASKFPDGGTFESSVEIESYPSVLSRKFSFAEEENEDDPEFDVMSTVSLDDFSLAENIFPVAEESLASISSKISSVYVNVLDTSSPRQFFETTRRETSDSAKRDAISLISHYVVTDTMVYTKVSSIQDILDTDFTAEFSISTPGTEFLNLSENNILESGSASIVTSTSAIELTLAESDLLSTFAVDVQSSYAVGVSMTEVDILSTPVESISSTHLTKSTAVSVKYVIEIPVLDATIRPSIEVSSTSVIDIAFSDLTESAASVDTKSTSVMNVEFTVMYAAMTPIKDVALRAVDISTTTKSSASKSEVVDTLSPVMSTVIPSPGDVLSKSDVASTIVGNAESSTVYFKPLPSLNVVALSDVEVSSIMVNDITAPSVPSMSDVSDASNRIESLASIHIVEGMSSSLSSITSMFMVDHISSRTVRIESSQDFTSLPSLKEGLHSWYVTSMSYGNEIVDNLSLDFSYERDSFDSIAVTERTSMLDTNKAKSVVFTNSISSSLTERMSVFALIKGSEFSFLPYTNILGPSRVTAMDTMKNIDSSPFGSAIDSILGETPFTNAFGKYSVTSVIKNLVGYSDYTDKNTFSRAVTEIPSLYSASEVISGCCDLESSVSFASVVISSERQTFSHRGTKEKYGETSLLEAVTFSTNRLSFESHSVTDLIGSSYSVMLITLSPKHNMLSSAVTKLPLLQKAILNLNAITSVDYSFKPSIVRLTSNDNLSPPLTADVVHVLTSTIYDVLASYVDVPTAVVLATPVGVISNFGEDPVSTTSRELFSSSVKDFKSSAVDFIQSRTIKVKSSWKRSPIVISGEGLSEILDASSRSDWLEEGKVLESEYNTKLVEFMVEGSVIPVVSKETGPVSIHRTQRKSIDVFNIEESVFSKVRDDYVEKTILPISVPQSMQELDVEKTSFITHDLTATRDLPYSTLQPSYTTKNDIDHVTTTTLWSSTVLVLEPSNLPLKLKSYTPDRSIAPTKVSSDISFMTRGDVTGRRFGTIDPLDLLHSNVGSETNGTEVLGKQPRAAGIIGYKELIDVLKETPKGVKNVQSSVVSYYTSSSILESSFIHTEDLDPMVDLKDDVIPNTSSQLYKGAPSYHFEDVGKRLAHTTSTYITQFTTFIKCISCTFIFKSFVNIVSSTVLVQTSPFTQTGHSFEGLGDLFDSMLLDPDNHFDTNSNEYFHSSDVGVAQQFLTPSSVVSTKGVELTSRMENIPDVKELDDIFQGDNIDTSDDYDSTRQQSTTPLSVPTLESEQLENILDYIQEFKAFASGNFSHDKVYVYAVDKDIGDVVDLNYKCLWSLHSDLESVLTNAASLSKCKQSLEVGKILSDDFGISPETISLLSSLRDASWLHEVISVLNIRLRKSHGQTLTHAEEEVLENVTKADRHIPVSPPVHKITKEMVTENLDRISTIKEALLKLRNMVNRKGPERQAREVKEISYDIFSLSNTLRSYLKPLVDDTYDLTDMLPEWNVEELLENYRTLEQFYIDHPEERTEEIDKIIRENDILIVKALSPVVEYENFERNRLDHMTPTPFYDEEIMSTTAFAVGKEEDLYLADTERSLYISVLQEYLDKLEVGLLRTLPIFAAYNGSSNYFEDFSIKVIDKVQDNLDSIEENIWIFHEQGDLEWQNMEEFNVMIELILTHVDQFTKKFVEKFDHLFDTLSFIRMEIIITAEHKRILTEGDCDDVTLWSDSHALDTTLNLSYIVKSYLEDINSTIPWHLKRRTVLSTDKPVRGYLLSKVESITLTVKEFVDDFLSALHSVDKVALKKEVDGLRITIDFTELSNTNSFSDSFFTKLDYLKIILKNGIEKAKHIIKCLQTLKLDLANSTETPPSVTLYNSATTILDDSLYGTTMPRTATEDIAGTSIYNQPDVVDNTYITRIKALLNFTQNIIVENPMDKTNVVIRSSLPDSSAISHTADAVLLTLKSIISYLQNRTSEVSENLDNLIKQHSVLMKEAKGNVNRLNEKAKLKLFMIYGESRNGRAAVAEEQLLRVLGDVHLLDSREPKLILPRNYMAHSSQDGVKYFDSWVIGKVAGYTLKEFAVLPPPLSPGQLQSYSLIGENMNRLRRIVIHGELSVTKMNDVDVERLAHHAIPLNKTSIRTPIQFKQKVEITGDLTASRIDNTFAEKFVLCKDNAVFNQAVIFTRDVQVAGDVAVADVINGLDVSTFNSRIMLMNSNHKVFNNFITFTSLKAERVYSDSVTVSGIPLDQIVEKGKPSTIAGNKTFHVLEVGDSTHLGVLDVRFINNLDIPKMFRDSLWKSTGELQIVTQLSQFQSLILNSDITTQGLAYLDKANTYSTLYLPRMAQNVVYKAKESLIISDIALSGAATVQSLMFYNMFDGVPAIIFNYGWLSKISDQLISGRLSAAEVNSSSVVLKPGATIYGVEIDHLSGAVRLDESARFAMDVDFGEVVCHRSISTEGLVQGWNLTLEGVHKSSDIIIFSAPKIFAAMVKVTEKLEVKGLVNTLDLRTECHTSPDHKLSIIGNVLIVRTTSAQMLEAGKHIIDDNAADIYWQKDKNTVFKHKVFFKHVNTSEVNSTINSINLSDLIGKILRKDCMHWDDVAIHNLTSNALNTALVLTNTVNGHPVSALGNILQKAGDQLFTGRITLNSILVEGDVSTGLQNKFDVSRLCQHHQLCHVHAAKFFSRDVSVLGAHQVTDKRTIQGVDVSEAFSNVLSNSGQILGMTRFQGNLILTDLRVDGLVDGVAVNKDSLLLRIGNQVMATPVSINSHAGRAVSTPEIEADEWAMGLMNISELNNKAVHRETLNVLRGPVNFVNEVQFNLSGMGLGDDHMGLKADTKLLLGDPQQAFKTMHHLSALNQNVLRDQVRELWGWLRVQIFEEPVERMTPIMVDSESRGFFGNVTSKTDLLALVPTMGSARILVHNSTEKQFEDPGIILEGDCTKRVAGYSSEGHEFVLTGHTCPEDSQQGQNGVKIWKLLPQGPQLWQFLSIQGVADMQMVLLDDKICVLIVESLEDHTSLYCKESGSFVSNYDIDENPQKVSVLHHTDSTGRKMTFFAIANQGEYPRESSYFAVWFYDKHTKRFNKIQEIELDNVVFVELASNQDEVLLVAVSQAFRGNLLGQVNIYRLDWLNNDSQKTPGQLGPLSPSGVPSRYSSTTTTASFYFLQQILVKKPFEAHFSKLNSDLYLFIINQEGFITWFSQKGIQRFTEEGKLHVAGKQQLEVWVSSVNESRSHWIAVSGQDCYYEDSTYNQEDTQILRAVIRGKRFQP